MLQRLSTRTLATVLALLLFLVQAEESFGGHVCPILDLAGVPHHTGMAGGHGSHPEAMSPGSGGDSGVCTLEGGMHPACGGVADPAAESDFEHCPCVGACQPTPGPAIAAHAFEGSQPPLLDLHRPTPPAVESRRAQWPPYFFPYSLAPPLG